LALGSWLSDAIAVEANFDYSELPHFPRSTTIGHSGFLVCAGLEGLPMVRMEGRFHAYEGYSYQQLTFPGVVMRRSEPAAHRLQRLRRIESAGIRKGTSWSWKTISIDGRQTR